MGLAEASALVDRLVSERAVALDGDSGATAAPNVCTWCDFRSNCTEHWSAVNAGLVTDAAKGQVTSITDSDAGLVSVVFSTAVGSQVLIGVDRESAVSLSVGETAMFFRVRRDPNEDSGVWHATRGTSIEVLSHDG